MRGAEGTLRGWSVTGEGVSVFGNGFGLLAGGYAKVKNEPVGKRALAFAALF